MYLCSVRRNKEKWGQHFKLCNTTMYNDSYLRGDGTVHNDYIVEKIEGVTSYVTKSNTSESVYVTYCKDDKRVVVRFSNHTCNSLEWGNVLDGNFATVNEIKFRLEMISRKAILVEKTIIGTQKCKKVDMDKYEELEYTIQDLYKMPIDTDFTPFIGKRCKNSQYVVISGIEKYNPFRVDNLGNKHYEVEKFIYE